MAPSLFVDQYIGVLTLGAGLAVANDSIRA
jgi:hypothetical protein